MQYHWLIGGLGLFSLAGISVLGSFQCFDAVSCITGRAYMIQLEV